MVRIICIGNRFAYPDNFGILIYEELKKIDLDYIELVEGGVGGMSLMPYFEDDKKILIVDYGSPNLNKILTNKDIYNLNIDEYNHSTSFLYLLNMVQKQFTIYLCQEEFNINNLRVYIKDILQIAKEL
jgi:Ni,Fe-hydrogenase maturation factor